MLKTLMKRIAAVALCAVIVQGLFLPALAQSDEVSGSRAASHQMQGVGYTAKLYNASNGLPTSDANAVLSSSDGFIWIGSNSGLIRYDGTAFERQEDFKDITGVNVLFEDDNGRLWVGTNDNGAVYLQNGEQTHISTDEGLASLSVSALAKDNGGRVFIGTKQGLFYADEDMNIHLVDDPRIERCYIKILTADQNGDIYGCTNEGALLRIREGKLLDFYPPDSIENENCEVGAVTTVCPTGGKSGEVWLGSGSGIVFKGSFDESFKDLQAFYVSFDEGEAMGGETTGSFMLSNEPIVSLECAADRLWVLINSMVFYLDENNDFRLLKDVPLNGGISSMTEDWEGNLWFTSSKQGVMKIVANRFFEFSTYNNYAIKSPAVNAVCKYDNMIFIGGDEGLDLVDMDYHYASSDIVGDIGGIKVSCMTEDNEGNIWVATSSYDGGLWRFDKDGGKKNYIESNGMPSNTINSLSIAPDGAVLASTSGGLAVIKDGKIEFSVTENSGLRNTFVLTALATKDGKYYLGTNGDGIYIEEQGVITHLSRSDGLTSDVIVRLKYDDKNDVIWLITSNSVEYIKDGVIHDVKGFPYKDNYDIFFDKNGKAWVLSSNGIYVVAVQDMLTKDEFEYDFYGVADGLSSVPTDGGYSFLDDNGDLYIACRSGVSVVNIDSYFSQKQDIKFSLPYIDDGENRYYPDDDGVFTLPSSAKNITIYGYALTYTMHDPLIQYSLNGADDKPITVNKSDMAPVRYTNLSGGEYEFCLSLIDGKTHEVRQTVTFKIEKKRTFYEHWWFYSICGVVFMIIMVLIAKYYLKRKTAGYIERERQHRKLRLFFEQTATALVNAIDAKDPYTHGHSSRVAEYSRKLAEMTGKSTEECNEVYYAALLHDVGKIGVPGNIINKETKLTDKEFETIKSHPDVGAHILQSISEFPFLSLGARFHHERYDGRGYPNGLKGEEIPDIARMVSVADAYDAMTSKRSYRDPIPQQKVREEFVKGIGTQFDPEYARMMLHLIDLDTEYEMKEKGDITELSSANGETVIDKHRSCVMQGVPLSQHMTTMRFEAKGSWASVSAVLFDSLDGRVHTTERECKDLNYFEYGEFFADGRVDAKNIRKSKTEKKKADKSALKEHEYRIEAVKLKDHVLIRFESAEQTVETVIALPDSSRFSYLGLTGENVTISGIKIDKATDPIAEGYIPRIAEEISYIDDTVGDMPNVQIDGYRTASSQGIALGKKTVITFHTMSLPTARLVWHCPFINIFTSPNGVCGGKGYRDLALMRLDGECWECDPASSCRLGVSMSDDFTGWDEWKKLNKKGFDCTVTITREGNSITVTSQNGGITLSSTAVLTGINEQVYAALTGDQCALTNIKVKTIQNA